MTHLKKLQVELQRGKAALLESLAASLLDRLLGVPFAVSKAGFQHGGDAGTTGRQDRHLRVECKRYADTTPLGERELQGEVDDAVNRSPDLEAWILISTRSVSENVQDTLYGKARDVGVPILVIDWTTPPGGIPDLAALCAWAPELVDHYYGKKAAAAATALANGSKTTVERIRKDLEPWSIGAEAVRKLARTRISNIWNSDIDSRALLAQNVAGGAADHLLRRNAVEVSLDNWWNSLSSAPVVAHGMEGVGKTWATMHWIVERAESLPITLIFPASSLPNITGISEASVMEFLAGEVHGMANAQDRSFWNKRLRRLLARPEKDGPVLLLVFDGLNQEPGFSWIHLLQVLQGGIFKNRVRILLTTQTHFLEEQLKSLNQLAKVPIRIGIEPYDVSDGGELDQMLVKHAILRSELPRDLIPLAKIPRLFPLVVKFRKEATLQGDVTISRLLWTYGRDSLGMRHGRAFSEREWEEWLVDLAKAHWESIVTHGAAMANRVASYSLKDLSESVNHAHFDAAQVYRRLNEIIDGTWMEPVCGASNRYRPRTTTINLALGAALLGRLEEVAATTAEQVDNELAKWLDPIIATPAVADILGAAASILVAKGKGNETLVTSAILTALLQGQNTAEQHRMDVKALAPAIVSPLLDVVERSKARAQATARNWALDSLRTVPSENRQAWEAIYDRMVQWVAHVDCPSPQQKARTDGAYKSTSDRLISRIGTDELGIQIVLGVSVRLHYWERDDLGNSIPRLLEGKPLSPAIRVLVAACVVAAIDTGPCWNGLKWLVFLNQVDRPTVIRRLEELSRIATTLEREVWTHPELPLRVAALLLWLTGDDALERRAAEMHTSFDSGLDYFSDYLSSPAQSYFQLERRHVEQFLDDASVNLFVKLRRSVLYLPDPTVQAPESLVDNLNAFADALDVSVLDSNMSHTREDYNYEEFQRGAARFAPNLLAQVVRRQLLYLEKRSGEARHWASLRATTHLLLAADADVAVAAQKLRQSKPVPPDTEEWFVSSQLLHVELLLALGKEQLDILAKAQDSRIPLLLLEVTQAVTANTLSAFIEEYGTDNHGAIRVLFNYLAEHGTTLSNEDFEKVVHFAFSDEDEDNLRTLAFIALSSSNAVQFGNRLLDKGWRVTAGQSPYECDHGSEAVLAASSGIPLSTLQYVISPLVLLREANRRGGLLGDVRLAASVLDVTVMKEDLTLDDPGADISVDRTDPKSRITISVAEDESDDPDTHPLLGALDRESHFKKEKDARERALAHLIALRQAGASLYATSVDAADARLLVEHCSAEVESWIDGAEERTSNFRRRANLAGGLFLALCEALLTIDPPRGVVLWHALSQTLRTNYTGLGGVSDLAHMPFRVPENEAVLELRHELYAMARNPTDKDLIDLVLCVTANGCQSWLEQRLGEDETSPHDWRRKRAISLRGLIACPEVCNLQWFEGPVIGNWSMMHRKALLWGNRQGLGRYWWGRFLCADSAEAAYAAWHVFLECVDRRAWAWLRADIHKHKEDGGLWRLKMLHYDVNRNKMERAMSEKETRTDRMDAQLFGWDSPAGWMQLAGL